MRANDAPMAIRLDPELLRKVNEKCEARGWGKTFVIRTLLQAWVDGRTKIDIIVRDTNKHDTQQKNNDAPKPRPWYDED